MKYQRTENLIGTITTQDFIIGNVSNDEHIAVIYSMDIIGILWTERPYSDVTTFDYMEF